MQLSLTACLAVKHPPPSPHTIYRAGLCSTALVKLVAFRKCSKADYRHSRSTGAGQGMWTSTGTTAQHAYAGCQPSTRGFQIRTIGIVQAPILLDADSWICCTCGGLTVFLSSCHGVNDFASMPLPVPVCGHYFEVACWA
jgi:hypothetical protein